MAGGIYNPFGFGGGEVPQPVPRRMPQDIPAAPCGFAPPPSKWDRVKQALWETNLASPIRGYYNLRNADPYTLYTDTGEAGQQAVLDSFDAAGGVTAGSAMIPKPSNALTMGIKAYHAGPHLFDKFEISPRTLGTGEGNNSFGVGGYLTESEGIGTGYRKNLSYKHLKDRFLEELPQDADSSDVEALIGTGYFKPDQERFLTELKNNDWLGYDYPSQAISAAIRGKLEDFDPSPELQDAANKLGHMYEVNVDADPNTFIDWDKPLSEQPEYIQKILGTGPFPAGQKLKNAYKNPMFGGDLVGKDKATPYEVSQYLKEKGVPGIRYLANDGSRSAGDGTRNYVVFDDKLISIVKKYGIAGASAMLGYNLLEGINPAQADELKRIEAGK
jgi:hypothetical protein